jgi:DNA-binding MarR family transcriptional regulator
MTTTPLECAKTILDVTPNIIQAIRFEMRNGRNFDLTVPQFRTLAYIQRNPGASLSAAAEFIGLTLSSMSILVNGLVERGLVERVTSTQDRRRIHLTLTPEGAANHRQALQNTEERLADVVSSLSDEQRAGVVESLELLRPLFLARALAPIRQDDADEVEVTQEMAGLAAL